MMNLHDLKEQRKYSIRSEEENRRKQKFAIWDYYRRKNSNLFSKTKETKLKKGK